MTWTTISGCRKSQSQPITLASTSHGNAYNPTQCLFQPSLHLLTTSSKERPNILLLVIMSRTSNPSLLSLDSIQMGRDIHRKDINSQMRQRPLLPRHGPYTGCGSGASIGGGPGQVRRLRRDGRRLSGAVSRCIDFSSASRRSRVTRPDNFLPSLLTRWKLISVTNFDPRPSGIGHSAASPGDLIS